MLTTVFTFMLSKVGRLVATILFILALIVAFYLYHKVTDEKIASLNNRVIAAEVSASELKTVNNSILTQMSAIKRAQDDLNASLKTSRAQSTKSQKSLHTLMATPSNPMALESAIQKQQEDRLATLRNAQ